MGLGKGHSFKTLPLLVSIREKILGCTLLFFWLHQIYVGLGVVFFISSRQHLWCHTLRVGFVKRTAWTLGFLKKEMDVSENSGTPKSSILIGFSIIFTIHFRGFPPIFENSQIQAYFSIFLHWFFAGSTFQNSWRWKSLLGEFCGSMYFPRKMNECPLKRDHLKRKFHLPTINFRGIS